MTSAEDLATVTAYNDARDPLHDILHELHWEAWKAGVFTSQEEWPDDEEQAWLSASVDSVAVGEHYEAWGNEAVEKLIAIRPADASGVLEALDTALEQYCEPMSMLNGHELGERLASDVAEIVRHARARAALASTEVAR